MQKKITPFLWFDGNAEAAAELYVSLFPNSKITAVARNSEAAPGPTGEALTVAFELDGEPFTALNGGPMYKFTEAVSFVIHCKDQAEVDHYWDGLLAGGGTTQACGWLKDRFGLSWQVTPDRLIELLNSKEPGVANRVMGAMMQMIKIDIAGLEAAAAG